jgi:hypothetical protein
LRNIVKKASAVAGLKINFGGSWKRIGPSFVARVFDSERKFVSCSEEQAKLDSWVMALGAFTAKRKPSGTESAHFAQVV